MAVEAACIKQWSVRFLGAALTVVALGGCIGSSPADNIPASAGTAPTSIAPVGAAGVGSVARPAPTVPGTSLLNSQLLTVADVPAGLTPSALPSFPSVQGCNPADDVRSLATGLDVAAFANASGTVGVGEVLAQYPSTAVASQAYAAGIANIDQCQNVAVTQDGVTLALTLQRVPTVSVFGDQSVTVQAATLIAGKRVTAADVLMRKGDEIAVVTYYDASGPDLTSLNHLAAEALLLLP